MRATELVLDSKATVLKKRYGRANIYALKIELNGTRLSTIFAEDGDRNWVSSIKYRSGTLNTLEPDMILEACKTHLATIREQFPDDFVDQKLLVLIGYGLVHNCLKRLADVHCGDIVRVSTVAQYVREYDPAKLAKKMHLAIYGKRLSTPIANWNQNTHRKAV